MEGDLGRACSGREVEAGHGAEEPVAGHGPAVGEARPPAGPVHLGDHQHGGSRRRRRAGRRDSFRAICCGVIGPECRSASTGERSSQSRPESAQPGAAGRSRRLFAAGESDDGVGPGGRVPVGLDHARVGEPEAPERDQRGRDLLPGFRQDVADVEDVQDAAGAGQIVRDRAPEARLSPDLSVQRLLLLLELVNVDSAEVAVDESQAMERPGNELVVGERAPESISGERGHVDAGRRAVGTLLEVRVELLVLERVLQGAAWSSRLGSHSPAGCRRGKAGRTRKRVRQPGAAADREQRPPAAREALR